MNKKLFEDVKIEYIYFDNCDILCNSAETEIINPDDIESITLHDGGGY